MDFGELDRLKHWLNEEFDHKHLNDVVPFQTSSERLAKHIYLKARIMYGDIVDAVAVSETDKTMAVYYE
jgi:6-pyruvoyltetrahydropterin/6-carboxytetrahydropterin synthase